MPKRRPDHQPQRTCAVCRTVRSKREMQRIVRTGNGEAVLDASGRMPGRGTYVCADPACQSNPGRETAIARALGIMGVANATA
jgi:hypothetical protein